MDQHSRDARLQRLDGLRSRRAADELLIAAIFGDVLVAREAPRDDVLATPHPARDVATATAPAHLSFKVL